MKKILFFDTETTGLPKRPGSPADPVYGATHSSNGSPKAVQLSWIVGTDDGKVLSMHDCLITPDSFTMPERASSVNGITDEMLTRKGKPFSDVIRRFLSDVACCSFVVAHNASFDMNVLRGMLLDSGDNAGLSLLNMATVRDTMKETAGWFGKNPRLTELHSYLFGEMFDGAHDAMNDTSAMMNCFYELVGRGLMKI